MARRLINSFIDFIYSKMAAGDDGEVPDLTSWNDFVETRAKKYFLDPMNSAFTPNGTSAVNYSRELEDGSHPLVVLPDDAMEILLGRCTLNDMLNMSLVCRRWKTYISTVSFWAYVYRYRNLNFNRIPQHVINRRNCWVVLHAIAKDNLLDQNFIRNPSGEGQLEQWNVVRDGGDGITVENPPIGCNPLPINELFNNTCCFVTSFDWSVISQTISFADIGMTPKVISLMAPFKLCLSMLIGTRFDCGAQGNISFIVRDHTGDGLGKVVEFTSDAGSNWAEIKLDVAISEDLVNHTKLQDMVITFRGSDRRYWAGHYGIKFARAMLKIDFPSEEDNAPPAAPADEGAVGYHLNFTTVNMIE